MQLWLQRVLENLDKPSDDPQVNLALKVDPASKAGLTKQLESASAEVTLNEHRMNMMIQAMKDSGILHATVDRNSLAGCLVPRLDAAYYPERVVVSITMQYFKQAEFPHKMVESLINCNKTVPIELLVNVDHPKVCGQTMCHSVSICASRDCSLQQVYHPVT